jgi:hypothetical protein
MDARKEPRAARAFPHLGIVPPRRRSRGGCAQGTKRRLCRARNATCSDALGREQLNVEIEDASLLRSATGRNGHRTRPASADRDHPRDCCSDGGRPSCRLRALDLSAIG